MGWKVMGIGHGFDGDDRDDEELRRAYEKGMRKGYERARHEMEGDDEYGDDDEYGERYSGGSDGGMYGGGGGSYGGGYGERQGVRGTGPYSRVTRDGYVRRNRRRY